MDLFIIKSKKVESFYPLHFFRKISDLRTGILTNIERYSIIYGKTPVFIDKLPEILAPGIYIYENFISFDTLDYNENTAIQNENETVGYYIKTPVPNHEKLGDTKVRGINLHYGFDIIKFLPNIIENDFRLLRKQRMNDEFDLLGDENYVYTGKNTKVLGKTFLNTVTGPIYIDDNVTFKGFNFIEGPCYIGKDTIVDSAKIRPGCSFGKTDRISGEIEHSLFLDYVNKHHDGFIGHSILGNWVNLGALTTNSDLKNNYHNIRMYLNEKTVDTGMLKMGAIIGDFSKTGIGTLINTGTIIGVCCNIFGGNITKKFYPSFSWEDDINIYSPEKAMDTIRITMGRRNVDLTDRTIRILKDIYRKERGKNGN